MAEGINSMLGEVASMMYRAMVDHLNQCIFLVRNVRVIDIDQAISAA